MTAREIIAKSIAMHPSLFRDACVKQAETHDNAIRLYEANPRADKRALQGARAQFNACLAVYDAVGREDIDYIMRECGLMVIALNIAAKLQCLPPHVRTAAAVAWDKGER